MSKLTLNVDDHLIEAAKKEAARREVSVSKMVSDYLRVVTSGDPLEDSGLPPITRSLKGILKDVDLSGDPRLEYLLDKHS